MPGVQTSKLGDQFVGETCADVVFLRVAAQICEWEHDQADLGLRLLPSADDPVGDVHRYGKHYYNDCRHAPVWLALASILFVMLIRDRCWCDDVLILPHRRRNL